MTFKPADTDYPIMKEMQERWSSRAISAKPIDDQVLHTLFEAARWAPSSSNLQPWRYLYATLDPADADMRQKLESLLTDGNYWAKHAYVLCISFADSLRTKSDGSTEPNYYALHDTGASNAYLALECTAAGLVAHQMGGFNKEEANTVLGVPNQCVPASMMAIGYPAEDSSFLNERHAEQESQERFRKPQKEFVFKGEWN